VLPRRGVDCYCARPHQEVVRLAAAAQREGRAGAAIPARLRPAATKARVIRRWGRKTLASPSMDCGHAPKGWQRVPVGRKTMARLQSPL
jgi:hypothetical protein